MAHKALPVKERGTFVAAFNPGVYRSVVRVRQAYIFDIAGLLMRFYSYMMSIGTVTMLSLSGYSFMVSGVVASVIALSIFLISPRISKLIDERGQSKVLPVAAIVVIAGLSLTLANVALKGPEWLFLPAALLMGCVPNAQALVRARWTYLIRTGVLKEDAPSIRTVFSFEGILDDIGFMLSPPISIALASSIAPIAGLLTGGIVFVIGVTMMCLARSSEPQVGWVAEGESDASATGALEKEAATPLTRPKSIIRTSAVVRMLFVLMLLTGAFYGTFDTAGIAFAEELGNPNIAGGALMMSAIVSAVMGLVFGMIHLRVPLYRQVTLFACLMGLAYGMQILIHTEIAFYVVSVVAALTYAPFLIVLNSATERAVPGKQLTEAITWVNSGMTCGVAFGPTLAGFVVDAAGATAGFFVGGLVALLIPIITLCCFSIIKRNVRDESYEVLATSHPKP